MPSLQLNEILPAIGALDQLQDRYNREGEPISVDFRALAPEASATERATHMFHSYPAKLLRHIPALFAEWPAMSQPGELIVDPFCGSGTVLVEAALAGRRAIGIDANPLARLIAAAKTTRIDAMKVRDTASAVLRKASRVKSPRIPNRVALSYWYEEGTLVDLGRLHDGLLTVQPDEVRAFLQVCLSSVARQTSLADPRVSVPVRLRSDQYPLDHWLHSRTRDRLDSLRHVDVARLFLESVVANLRRLSDFSDRAGESDVRVLQGDARHLEAELVGLDRRLIGHVDAVMTSPPYLSAQKYVRASSLGLLILDLVPGGQLQSLTTVSIGREHFRKAEYHTPLVSGVAHADVVIERVRQRNPLRAHLAATYLLEMSEAVREMRAILKPDGKCVMVMGANRLCGESFPTPSYLEAIAHREGFRTSLVLIDAIRSRGLMTRRNASASVIPHEVVIVLEKGPGE
jgi:DNA modification methylase